MTTIVSSDPFSLDLVHYMYQQMIVEREEKRLEENLSQHNAIADHLTTANVKKITVKEIC